MLKLPDVTLVMMDGTCPELAALSVEDSLKQVEFGETIIFSPTRIDVEGARWVQSLAWCDMTAFNEYLWYAVPPQLSTRYMILSQWDSWVVDASQWTDEFLDYDYVGAPWCYDDGMNVGNGCALRSLRLMRFLADNKQRFPLAQNNEDDLICRRYRLELEGCDFRWPPEQLAAKFSVEGSRPAADSKHFMFHAPWLFPLFLDGEWLQERRRLVNANDMIKPAAKANLQSGLRPMILPRLAS